VLTTTILHCAVLCIGSEAIVLVCHNYIPIFAFEPRDLKASVVVLFKIVLNECIVFRR
jgi:hypothetical protein